MPTSLKGDINKKFETLISKRFKKETLKRIDTVKRKVVDGLGIVQNAVGVFAMVTSDKKLSYVTLGTNLAQNILSKIPTLSKPEIISPSTFGYIWSARAQDVFGTCTWIFFPVLEEFIGKSCTKIELGEDSYLYHEESDLVIEDIGGDYAFYGKDEGEDGFYERIESLLRDLIKQRYNASSYVIETEASTNRIVLRENTREPQKDLLSVKQIDEIYEMLMKYLNKGYNRSIILDGQPGCGKSVAIRYIADRFSSETDKKIIHIISSDAFEDVASINQLIKVLDIKIAIIDDFDRITESEHLLTQIEELRENLDLLFISTNHLDQMDGAVKRPGRFDQVIRFDDVLNKKEFVDRMGYQFEDDFIDRLTDLSIAGLCEFTKRVDVLGGEKAMDTFDDLENR